jgi:hypothetical protein
MHGGHLLPFTPTEVSGYSTPFISDHLPPGAISYNANGTLAQNGGRRRSIKRKSIKRRSIKRRSIKRRSIKRKNKKSNKRKLRRY